MLPTSEVEAHILREAKMMTNSDAWQEMMELLRQDAVTRFTASAPNDPEARELAYHMHTALEVIQQQFAQWAALAD